MQWGYISFEKYNKFWSLGHLNRIKWYLVQMIGPASGCKRIIHCFARDLRAKHTNFEVFLFLIRHNNLHRKNVWKPTLLSLTLIEWRRTFSPYLLAALQSVPSTVETSQFPFFHSPVLVCRKPQVSTRSSSSSWSAQLWNVIFELSNHLKLASVKGYFQRHDNFKRWKNISNTEFSSQLVSTYYVRFLVFCEEYPVLWHALVT